MANTPAGSVYVCDTTGLLDTKNLRICSVRYIAGTGTPSVIIRKGSSSGTTIYECADTTSSTQQLEWFVPGQIHVTIAGTGTKIYLYTDND